MTFQLGMLDGLSGRSLGSLGHVPSGVSDPHIFNASLQASLIPERAGNGTPTFTRATVAYVADWENLLKPVLSGEARFTSALLGQGDHHDTFIARIACAGNHTLLFEPLEQRRQRVRIEQGALADLAHRTWRPLPQHHQHHILRIGQAESFQQGLVLARQQARSGI